MSVNLRQSLTIYFLISLQGFYL